MTAAVVIKRVDLLDAFIERAEARALLWSAGEFVDLAEAVDVLWHDAEREVTNTRLALRKRRGGPNGEEHPFTVRTVDMGPDQHGRPMSTLVMDWGAAQATQLAAKERWSKSLRLLRQVLMTILADHGRDQQPYADGPTVRACDLELVRQEFYRQYPADGDEKQKTETRRQAFYRAIKTAQEASLIAIRELDGVQLVWLTKPEA